MKKILFQLCVVFLPLLAIGQTGKFMFINNNSAEAASSLDIEIYNVSTDSVLDTIHGIDFSKASTIIEVPSTTILTFNFYEAGTNKMFYEYKNAIFDEGQFSIGFLYGDNTSMRFTSFTGDTTASDENIIEYNFRHSTKDLEDIDLIIRDTSIIMADNFSYGDGTFSFENKVDAKDYILDITPMGDNNIGLFAYELPGSDLKGEFIVLFTNGTATDNDMYMVKMDGTSKKLNWGMHIKHINKYCTFGVYGDPEESNGI